MEVIMTDPRYGPPGYLHIEIPFPHVIPAPHHAKLKPYICIFCGKAVSDPCDMSIRDHPHACPTGSFQDFVTRLRIRALTPIAIARLVQNLSYGRQVVHSRDNTGSFINYR